MASSRLGRVIRRLRHLGNFAARASERGAYPSPNGWSARQAAAIRFLPDNHGKGEAGFFSARKGFGFLQRHIADKVEAAEEISDFLFAHFGRKLLNVPNRALVGADGIELVLGKIADIEFFRTDDAAGEQIDFARQGFDKRRFTAAVNTHSP